MPGKKPKLSARAEALLLRVKRGDWYEAFPNTQRGTPKAMQELCDAGLVSMCGRAKILVLCWVPRGYRYKGESWPAERKRYGTRQMRGLDDRDLVESMINGAGS